MNRILLLVTKSIACWVCCGCLFVSFTALSNVLSKQQVVAQVVQQFQAKVLSIRQAKQGDQSVYIVRLLTTRGRVKTIIIDANTGAVIANN